MLPETDQSAAFPLRVAVRQQGSTAVLDLRGEFDLASIEVAQAGLAELLAIDAEEMIIDLSGVSFIDSTGIAFLLTVSRSDGDIPLRFVPSEAPAVKRVLALTGIEENFGGPQEHR